MPDNFPRSSVTARTPFGVWALVAAVGIVAGTYLRSTQLPIQILLDDEWHAIHKLISTDSAGILKSFGLADYSIPLTLYYRFLALHGGLTEWQMHLPLLLAGIALLVVAPLLLRRRASPAVLATWVVLLAISPIHVYLSRTARPYALTCLLVVVALFAFRKAVRNGRGCWRYGVVYVIATVLAGWLHLVTLPFTLLPFLYCAILLARQERDSRFAPSFHRLLALAFITGISLAVLLTPPLLGSRAELLSKAAADSVTLQSLYRTALMMFGTRYAAVLAAGAIFVVIGGHRWWQQDREFLTYVGFVCLGAAIAIVGARPQWIQHPLVLARYLLPALPFLLLLAAEGIVLVVAALPATLASSVVVVGAIALLWTGPIPAYLYAPNQFMGHQRFQFDYDDDHNPYVYLAPREPLPAFYSWLASRPPHSLTLIEAPWRLESDFIPDPWYQKVHRQYVKIGLVTPVCGIRDFGEYPSSVTMLRFRFFVHLSEILEGRFHGAEYLIMHLSPWKLITDPDPEWPNVAACLPKIEAVLGAPVYRDKQIVVFDMVHGGLRP